MTLCIFASEVAALAGLHRFKTQEEAVRAVLKRRGVLDAADRAEAQRVRFEKDVRRVQSLVDTAYDNAREKKATAHAAASAAATKAQSVISTAAAAKAANESKAAAEILSDLQARQERANASAAAAQIEAAAAQKEAAAADQKAAAAQKRALKADARAASAKRAAIESRRLEHLEKEIAIAETPAVQESIARAVARSNTALDAIKASALPTNCSADVKRALEGTVARAMGVKQEPQNLRDYEASTPAAAALDVKQRGYTLRGLITAKGMPYCLFGRLDGLRDDGVVVESKCRRNRLFGSVPEYERIQLMAYMALTKAPRAVLVENFHEKQQTYDVAFDDVFWESILKALGKGVDCVYERL